MAADETDITIYCFLEQDNQTINCLNTGLVNDTYDVVVTYRSGWSAYNARDVIVRLVDSTTIVGERVAGRTGYGLTGIYLTAAEVSSFGLSWTDANVGLRILATPLMWAEPAEIVVPITTWHTNASMSSALVELASRLRVYLAQIEQDDDLVTGGDYVLPTFITDAGTTLSREAFSLIQTAIPEAFEHSRVNPWPTAIATPADSMVAAVATAAAGTDVYVSMGNLDPTAGLFVTLIFSFVFGFGIFMPTKNAYLGTMTWFATLMGGWLLFAIPFAIVFIPAAGFAALGFMAIAKKVFN